jgi:hypothetical protein
VTFEGARITSIVEDEAQDSTWPLQVLGFDCWQKDKSWSFVLRCVAVEWTWQSEWPLVMERNEMGELNVC